MATKSKKSSKTKVKVGKLSQSKKDLGKGAMKKVKGGSVPHNYKNVKIDF